MHVEPACEDALKELERRGYVVRRVRGYAAVDQARNHMATDALAEGFQETMWIDSDVSFDPDVVDQLRAHRLPVVCGIYPRKGQRCLTCHVLPETTQLIFGAQGGLMEILYAAAGFLLVQREVYVDIQARFKLPTCNERFGQRMVPFYQPMVVPDGDGYWYLPEDYAFCERARRCGYKVWADTSIRLWHHGGYAYGWEDAGIEQKRFGTFYFDVV
jgi:hypothetical protein